MSGDSRETEGAMKGKRRSLSERGERPVSAPVSGQIASSAGSHIDAKKSGVKWSRVTRRALG